MNWQSGNGGWNAPGVGKSGSELEGIMRDGGERRKRALPGGGPRGATV